MYSLAKELGIWDVRDLLGKMTWEQLLLWHEYSEVDPFGETRADLRAGIISSVIANVNRAKNQRSFSPSDFMPKFNTGASEKESKSKPITTKSEWSKVKDMARIIAGPKVVEAK